ncbi:MAG TPA: alpha/beta fold hydrolase [Candidatus Methylomirabilis sp.]|nr:alpha/beta fold hydrolase [Candidatus Methylomirabilis sp.]
MLDLRHLSLHGHEFAYRLEGEGQTLVLIHGIASDSRTWLEAMRRLSPRYRVLAIDLLGHGASAKPVGDYSLGAHACWVRDFLQALGIHRATLVGHSLGGGIALQLTYQFPELCERVVLVSSGGLGRDVSPLLRALSLPGAELVLSLAFPPFVVKRGEALRGWLQSRGIRAPGLAEKWNAYASLADGETRRAFVRELRAVVDHGGQFVSARDRLYLARYPTLIVWGDRDSMIPASHARLAHEAIRGSRLEIFPGAEHFPHAEFPDRFAELLTAFVESTSPGPAEPARDQASGSASPGP